MIQKYKEKWKANADYLKMQINSNKSKRAQSNAYEISASKYSNFFFKPEKPSPKIKIPTFQLLLS